MGEPKGAGPATSPNGGSPAGRADVILTPDQRVRVFISSTLGELADERAAARRAIARLHLVPVWYESGARPHPPRPMYRAYLAQSQVFVGIYWQRYGWVAPGMEISGLEDEFRLAAGKPMLLYLKRPAPELEPRLAAMIDGIRAAGSVSYRTNPRIKSGLLRRTKRSTCTNVSRICPERAQHTGDVTSTRSTNRSTASRPGPASLVTMRSRKPRGRPDQRDWVASIGRVGGHAQRSLAESSAPSSALAPARSRGELAMPRRSGG
jgi:hypothetical protein